MAPQPLSTRARWVLRIALIVAWGSGVAGTALAGQTLLAYRSPIPAKRSSAPAVAPSTSASEAAAPSASPSVSAAPSASVAPPAVDKGAFSISAHEREQAFEAQVEALERFKRTRIPLSAANLVLSIALVLGAARTIGRRPGGRVWLQQVCIATALFAVVEFRVSRHERNFLVERLTAITESHLAQRGMKHEQVESAVRLRFLFNLLAQLGLYGGLAIALGRPSVGRELAPPSDGRASIPPSSDGEDS